MAFFVCFPEGVRVHSLSVLFKISEAYLDVLQFIKNILFVASSR